MKRQHLMFIVFVIVFGMLMGQFQANPKRILSTISDIAVPFLDDSWTLVATGDVIPARSVNYQMTVRDDFLWPVRDITNLLHEADISLINLESPLVENCPLTNEGMVFCGDQRFIEALTYTGVDVASLANNHILNYGWQGLEETEKLLAKNGIGTTGMTSAGSCAGEQYFCSKKTVREVKNTLVGFLGYTIVGKSVDRSAMSADISSFDREVDVLVVSIHWGAEYTRVPVGSPDDPREIARLAVDAGADVIIGNHPHWVQGMEYIDSAPVFYALGNTIFDQEWSMETKTGVIAEIEFDGAEVKSTSIHPVRIHDYGRVELLEDKDREAVIKIFESASEKFK